MAPDEEGARKHGRAFGPQLQCPGLRSKDSRAGSLAGSVVDSPDPFGEGSRLSTKTAVTLPVCLHTGVLLQKVVCVALPQPLGIGNDHLESSALTSALRRLPCSKRLGVRL